MAGDILSSLPRACGVMMAAMIQRSRPVFTFLAVALVAGCSPATRDEARPATRVDVVELSATEAARRLRDGALTAHDLTQAYLDRIAAIDDAGPALNAVIEINPK